MSPQNASISADGFRFYEFSPSQAPAQQALMRRLGLTEQQCSEPTNVLSVTSIRSLNGIPFQLAMWQVNNVVTLVMGTRSVPAIGKRGKPLKGKKTIVADGPFPGEFVTRMIESRGKQDVLENIRAWVKSTADEPRDIAAVRGSVVHRCIELNIPMRKLDEEAVRGRFEEQWSKERRRVKPAITQEDIDFVINGMKQFWNMRQEVPFVILAQEPQVFNLTAGYAGSADVLCWFLPEGSTLDQIVHWQTRADRGDVTLDDVAKIGGDLAVGDWKTSESVFVGHVVQTTAYMSAQFVARDGVIDERLTELLRASMSGLVIHIRPEFWEVAFFEQREDVLMAFLGSLQFARLNAEFKRADRLFTRLLKGSAPDSPEFDDEEESVDASAAA